MQEVNKILGVPVTFGLTKGDFLQEVEKFILRDNADYICTVNPEFIIDAQEDKDFKDILQNSSLNIPDGVGVLFANEYLNSSKNIKSPIRKFIKGSVWGFTRIFTQKYKTERLAGAELIFDICKLAEERNYNIFLLGGGSLPYSVSERAAEVLLGKYPKLNIVGYTSEFNREAIHDKPTVEYIINCMKEKNVGHIDIIFVSYGHRHQEKWLMRNQHNIPAKLGIGVGGTLDFIAQKQTRAPNFITKHNLEWLFRLITQPWRLTRIVKAFPVFPLKVYFDSIKTQRNTETI